MTNINQRSSISILIGAGFSVPLGYPTGGEMNNRILHFEDEPVAFEGAGRLVTSTDGTKLEFGFESPYQTRFNFCLALIKEYSKHQDFDYEQFMDFISGKDIYDEKYLNLAKNYSNDMVSCEMLISGLGDIYSQMVDHLLKDANGKSWYGNQPFHIGDYTGKLAAYNSFLHFLNEQKQKSIINIHSLNHDLLLESFNLSGYINGDLSDGFDDYRSPFYGKYRDERTGFQYTCRLSRYTGRYFGKPIRLYKLHGSINYATYKKTTKMGYMQPYREIKLVHGIYPLDLLREKKNECGYESDHTYYHADFLTGTTSKIKQYRSKVFYKKMFRQFKNNLKKADALIIIGYGGKDNGINQYLLDNFDYRNKQTIIIDKYFSSNEDLKTLKERMNATVIEKGIEEISGDILRK